MTEKLELAAALGRAAFAAGKKRVPVHDGEFCRRLYAAEFSGAVNQALQAWSRAWDTANLQGDP